MFESNLDNIVKYVEGELCYLSYHTRDITSKIAHIEYTDHTKNKLVKI